MTRTLLILSLTLTAVAAAADRPYRAALEGKWIQRDTHLVLDVTRSADGMTFTYSVPGSAKAADRLSFDTQFDGADVPIVMNDAPTGQTIAITVLDDRHAASITKFQGKTTGTSKSELSDDGKVLRVDNDVAPAGSANTVHRTEVWDKQ